MKKNNIPETLGIFISLSGLAVLAGWFLADIETLKSILPVWALMKFSTALSFFLSGIMLYFVARFQKQDTELAIIMVPIMSMAVFLLMTSLLAATILGIDVDTAEMLIKDSMITAESIAPDKPSVVTMLNFILMAMAGIFTVLNIKRLKKAPAFLGITVAIIGLTAVLGYAFDQPLFYFWAQGKSGAMALYSAVLFVLWGIGIISTEGNK